MPTAVYYPIPLHMQTPYAPFPVAPGGLPVTMNMLQYVWFNLPGLWHWPSIRVLHYQYEKPWEKDHPKAEKLKPLIDLWQAFYQGRDIPDIDSLPDPVTGNA